MSRVKIGFSGLSVSEQVERARLITGKMTGNATYTTPNPTLAVVNAAADALESAYNDSRGHDSNLVAVMNLRRGELLYQIFQLASYVQEASGGDEEKILSSGFSVKGPRSPRTEVAGMVFNVRLSDGRTAER